MQNNTRWVPMHFGKNKKKQRLDKRYYKLCESVSSGFSKNWVSWYKGNKIYVKFNVLLTVHHEMILGNCPTWRTNSFRCIYLFIVPYMFRACHAHHQEKQIVSIQLLVIVTPCWWQCRMLVGSKLPTSTRHCHQNWVTITRSCIDTICFSWWWARHARNM